MPQCIAVSGGLSRGGLRCLTLLQRDRACTLQCPRSARVLGDAPSFRFGRSKLCDSAVYLGGTRSVFSLAQSRARCFDLRLTLRDLRLRCRLCQNRQRVSGADALVLEAGQACEDVLGFFPPLMLGV